MFMHGVLGGEKKASGPLDLEFQVVVNTMSMLRIEPRSSAGSTVFLTTETTLSPLGCYFVSFSVV